MKRLLMLLFALTLALGCMACGCALGETAPVTEGIVLEADGETFMLTEGKGAIIPGSEGYATARSYLPYPGVPDGLQSKYDLIYMSYTDGTDTLILMFPAQIKSGNVITAKVGKPTMIRFERYSALNASDCGPFIAQANCSSGNRNSKYTYGLYSQEFQIVIDDTDKDHSYVAGSFTAKPKWLGVTAEISGTFYTTLQ